MDEGENNKTYTIYGELPVTINHTHSLYIELIRKTECFIDNKGYIIKKQIW